MTRKQRMLSAIAGDPLDMIPWAPRLDLWYNANKRAGTLPVKYKKATLTQIVDDLDMGYHAVIPDFKDLRDPGDEVHRALGIYNLRAMPYATVLENVGVEVDYRGDETVVEYHTPVGDIRTRVLYDEAMRKAGVSITHVLECAIKSGRDYAAVGYIFENARVIRNYDGYAEFAADIGERGLAVAFVSLAASPMHLLQRELMPMHLFFYELYDHPEEIGQCASKIGGYLDRVFEAVAECPAETFLLGANYDAGITYPPFFAEHILPWLKRMADRLHQAGKLLFTHADGENTGLLEYYLASRIDAADSICPHPMTKLSFREVRDVFAGAITIMGGVPSICLLPEVMPNADFEAYLDQFFQELGSGDRLILGISDTAPPSADFERMLRIGDRVKAWGPVQGRRRLDRERTGFPGRRHE